MKIVKFILILVLFLVIGGSYAIAQAQDDRDTQTSVVTLSIPPTCRLMITQPDSSRALTADGAAEAAFNDGYVELDAGKPTLKVFANKDWKLTAKSSGFTGPYVKAIGDLQLKDAGSEHVAMGSYTSLSAADQEVASYDGGVKNESHPCQYKILLDYTKDMPGTYEAIVTYTLSTNGS